MCGRFNLSTPAHVLAEAFGLIDVPQLHPRYNIAPTQPIPVIRLSKSRSDASGPARIAEMMHWGLIPFWAKDPSIGSRMINARCETIAEKPAYRKAFQRRRCLIPADGFYEWKKLNAEDKARFGYTGKGQAKQPMFIHLASGEPFAFAGLYEHWQDPEGSGSEITSCTIITTNANDFLKPVHDRMPVIVRPNEYDHWLTCDPEEKQSAEEFAKLFEPYPSEEMDAWFVSRKVNSPKTDEPSCIEPIESDSDSQGSLF